MGIGGIGIWQLLIILAIVLLLFGTKKLRNLGGDLGSALRNFKKAVNDEDERKPAQMKIGGGSKKRANTRKKGASKKRTAKKRANRA